MIWPASSSRSIRHSAFFYRIGPQILVTERFPQFHQFVRERLKPASRRDLLAIGRSCFGPNAPGYGAPACLERVERIRAAPQRPSPSAGRCDILLRHAASSYPRQPCQLRQNVLPPLFDAECCVHGRLLGCSL